MSEETADGPSSAPSLDWPRMVRRWAHVPVLVVLMGFMLWVRVKSWRAFIFDGAVVFPGNDPWYHYRQVVYTVRHWPSVMPFDPWTHFPYGTSVGQFGTLFDQLIATAALLIGAGSPTIHQIRLATLFAPPVFGTLVAIPTYAVGKRLGGRVAGIFAAAVLAFLPGVFFDRSLVGFADHNIAEPLFQATAVLGLMIAVAVAQRERPIWEQVLERDIEALRPVIGWSAIAGVATAVYVWVWPPGVFLIGIFGVYLLVKLTSDFVNGTSPDHVAFAGAISMGVTGILVFVPFTAVEFATSRFSLLQPAGAFAVATAAVFLAWLAREWESRSLDEVYYPAAVLGIVVVGVGAVAVILPDLLSLVQRNLLRIIGFNAGAATRTIGEAQPFPADPDRIFSQYGMTFFTAVIGGAWIILRPHLLSEDPSRIGFAAFATATTVVLLAFPVVGDSIGAIFAVEGALAGLFIVASLLAALIVTAPYDAERLLVVIWGAFIVAAAFTQVRFNYYLAVPVAIMNGYLLGMVLRYLGLDTATIRPADIEVSHVFSIAAVVLVVLLPLVAPISYPTSGGGQVTVTPVWEAGDLDSARDADTIADQLQFGVLNWSDTLQWMKENTPAEGDYGNAGNAGQLDIYGTYPRSADFDYPDGSYGVMSWWDYGHWITVRANRIPVANPFQQGADTAANYLLAPNESRANAILDKLDEDDATTRYVAIDWKMVTPGSKFGAPTVFYDDIPNTTYTDFIEGRVYYRGANRYYQVYLKTQRYYESQMVRLYRYHGSAKQIQPIVADFERRQVQTRGGQTVTITVYNRSLRFRNMSAARDFVARDGSAQIGGVRSNPPEASIPAMEHYRLVDVTEKHLAPARYIIAKPELSYGNFPTWVKLFERVPGATVHGTAPPNTTVQATVEMAIPFPKRPGTFNYTQYAETGPDGEFTMTLPYASTGYSKWGPSNGYTNVSVRATGPYTFTTPMTVHRANLTVTRFKATAHVSEAKVIGEDPAPVRVDLDRVVVSEIPANQTGGNQTAGNTSTNATQTSGPPGADTNQTADDTSSTSGTANSTSSIVGPRGPVTERRGWTLPEIPTAGRAIPIG